MNKTEDPDFVAKPVCTVEKVALLPSFMQK